MFDPLECALLRGQLAEVVLRIAQSETIARQRAEIAELEASGCDTEPDRELLSQFERLLELQIDGRDWLVKKLASYEVL